MSYGQYNQNSYQQQYPPPPQQYGQPQGLGQGQLPPQPTYAAPPYAQQAYPPQKYPQAAVNQVNQPTEYPQSAYGSYTPLGHQPSIYGNRPNQEIYTPAPPIQPPSGNVAEKFNPRPKWQDLWALLLFIVNFVAFTVLSVIAIRKLISEHNDATSSFVVDGKFAALVVVIVAVGAVLSFIYMLLMQAMATFMCHASMILSIVIYGAAAAYFFISHQIVFGIIWVVLALFCALAYYGWRSKIPFASLMLSTVTRLTRRFYGTLVVQILITVVQILVTIWWLVSVIGMVLLTSNTCASNNTTAPNQTKSLCVTAGTYISVIYLVFSFYWISCVVKNIGHITSAGVFASYYFLEGTPQQQNSPTFSSLKRACTTSLGPNCFGSLIIAIIATIKALAQSAQRGSDDVVGMVLGCIAVCIISCIESIAEYITHYAFVFVAMYGQSYCEGAKNTFRILRDRGVEQIINDSIIGSVLGVGSLLIGVLCALVGFGFVHTQNPAFNSSGNFTIPVIIAAFVVGISLFYVVADVISSGVSTIFVGLAEDPNAMATKDPRLWQMIVQTYPGVIQGV